MKKFIRNLKVYKSFLSDILAFWKLTKKYNASTHTDDDIEKMQYTLLRENHTLEKGLSLRSPRKGFGQQKVMNLLDRLDQYAERFGGEDIRFLSYPLGVVKHYISYTKSSGVEIPEIEKSMICLSLNPVLQPLKNRAESFL